MEQRISAWEARRHFGRMLKDVSTNRTMVIVEQHGEEIAAIVPLETYRQIQRAGASFYEQLRSISEEVNLSEEEAAPIIDAAMRETGRLPE